MKELKAGHMLAGRYEIVRTLGTGVFGNMYEAKGPLKERLAAKVLAETGRLRENYDKDYVEIAQIWSMARHPNVARIMDAGISQDGAFSVMEFLEGRDLAGLLWQKGRMEWSQAKPVFMQACDALSAVHGVGIVYRDVHPGQFLMVRGQEGILTKLLPSELMGSYRNKSPGAKTGFAIGIIQYMSPEQARIAMGDILDNLDGRADIYALGVILHRALTGKPVFKGGNEAETLFSRLSILPGAPGTLAPGLSSDVDAVVMRALQIDPAARYQTAAEFRAAIESAKS